VNDDDRSLKFSASNEELVVLVIRIVCLGLLGYWSFILIRPFLTIIVWSIIITVALYPIFDWLSAKLHGHRALAAVAITVFTFFVMLGPVTWLALSLAETARMLLARFGEGSLAIPPPSEAVQAWPLIGEKMYEVWELASTNLQALVVEVAPHLKPLGTSLLNAAGSVGINLLKFTVSLIISGFLFIPGPSLIHSTKNVLGRVAAGRGESLSIWREQQSATSHAALSASRSCRRYWRASACCSPEFPLPVCSAFWFYCSERACRRGPRSILSASVFSSLLPRAVAICCRANLLAPCRA
jgi:predicted PurR-regulated permease PerM